MQLYTRSMVKLIKVKYLCLQPVYLEDTHFLLYILLPNIYCDLVSTCKSLHSFGGFCISGRGGSCLFFVNFTSKRLMLFNFLNILNFLNI